MIRLPARLPYVLLALLVLGTAAPAPTAADEAKAARKQFKSAVRVWNQAKKEKEFKPRRAALDRIAACGTPEALAYLLTLGVKGKHRGGEHFQQILTRAIAKQFPFGPHAEAYLEAFTTTHAEPTHAYLVHRVCRAKPSKAQDRAILDALPALAALPYHRAAALRALALRANPAHVAPARACLEDLRDEPVLRAVTIEAVAAVLAANATKGWTDAKAKPHIESLIDLLDTDALPARSRMVIGRSLARVLDTDIAYADSASWNKHLGRVEAEARLKKEGYAVEDEPRPTFLGVRSLGRDVVYVIDISESMLTPTRFRPGLRRPTNRGRRPGGPVTGESRRDADDRKAKREGREAFDPFSGLADVDPKDIRNRLDLLKAALAASVSRLLPTQRFAIVIFGTEARLLLKEDGLVPATKPNVKSALKRIKGLGAFGATNAHRGLEIAFQIPADIKAEGAHVSAASLLEGADTVFFLSDGAPSTDSYSPTEETYFAFRSRVLEAVRRWNLFRDCEIHALGFTQSNMDFLKDLARIGRGRFVDLGP